MAMGPAGSGKAPWRHLEAVKTQQTHKKTQKPFKFAGRSQEAPKGPKLNDSPLNPKPLTPKPLTPKP